MEQLISLDDLITDVDKNTGGCVGLHYATIDSLLSFPFFLVQNGVSGFEYNREIEFKEDYDWLKATVKPHNKLSWSITKTKTASGIRYKIECGGILTQHSTRLLQELHKMTTKEYILRLKDRDGLEIVMGDMDLPFSFSWGFVSGDNIRQLKNCSIKWTAVCLSPPLCELRD